MSRRDVLDRIGGALFLLAVVGNLFFCLHLEKVLS